MSEPIPPAFRIAVNGVTFEVSMECPHSETIGEWTCYSLEDLLLFSLVLRFRHFGFCDCSPLRREFVARTVVDAWREEAHQ